MGQIIYNLEELMQIVPQTRVKLNFETEYNLINKRNKQTKYNQRH